jgi:hypothetical protein
VAAFCLCPGAVEAGQQSTPVSFPISVGKGLVRSSAARVDVLLRGRRIFDDDVRQSSPVSQRRMLLKPDPKVGS